MESSKRSQLSGGDVIVVALSDWDGPRRIRQYMTEELSLRGNRILFVEAGFTLTKAIRTRTFSRLFRFLRGARSIHEGLTVITAPPFIPGGEFSSLLSRFNWWITRPFIRFHARRLGLTRPALLVFAYNGSPLLGRLGESTTIYLCNDAFAQMHTSPFLRRRVTALERTLVERVDLTVTVGETLTEEKRAFARRIGTIHHGVDLRLFDRTLGPSPAVPDDIAALPHPIVGYSGVVRDMIDPDLLEFSARSRPSWSFVLVGPLAESSARFYRDCERLRLLPNVHFLGSKPAESVPLYLNFFDVCVLPYAQSDVLKYYAVPLKFYEYVAAGKPVVWTIGPRPLPKEILQHASTREEFVSALDAALSMNSPESVAARKALARENSWSRRAEELAALVHDAVASRPG